jgi:CheY-like chemotaxis protein
VRILVVEDDEAFQDTIRDALTHDEGDIEISFASNASEAYIALSDPVPYDLVVCDLRIPFSDDGAPDVAHGIAVANHVATTMPGTPIRLLSAFGTFEIAGSFSKHSRQDDPFGGNEIAMARPYGKSELPEFAQDVTGLARDLRDRDSIEVATGTVNLDLDRSEQRVIKTFAMRQSGRVARVRPLFGGLSKSRTLRVVVEDRNGATVSNVVAKLGTIERVLDERRRYDQFIAPNLGAATFAPMAGSVTSGAGGAAGLFYAVAEPAEPLLNFIRSDDSRAETVIESLRSTLEPWRHGAPSVTTTIGALRTHQIPDELLPKVESYLDAVHWRDVEPQELQARLGPSHGDLHGENILVLGTGAPILIDYGRTARTSLVFDPVMLELALALHPAGHAALAPWPDEAQAEHWANLDDFLVGCPAPGFVRRCREWAHDVAAGDREVLACAYSYAMRQLQFERTPRPVAVALIRGLVRRLSGS